MRGRAYFSVQLLTICEVVKSKCAELNVQLLHRQLANYQVLCSCKSCLKYALIRGDSKIVVSSMGSIDLYQESYQ